MAHTTHLLKGAFKPKAVFTGLGDAKSYTNFKRQFLILLLISGIIEALNVYFIYQIKDIQEQLHRLGTLGLEGIGSGQAPKIIWSFIDGSFMTFAGLFMITFIIKLFFWEISYMKLFVIEAYITVITVMMTGLNDLVTLSFHLSDSYDYTSLALIGLLFTHKPVILALMSLIGFGTIWSCYVEIRALFEVSTRSRLYVAMVVIGIQVVLVILGGVMIASEPSLI